MNGCLYFILEVPPNYYLRIGSGEQKELISESHVRAVLSGTAPDELGKEIDMTEISEHSTVNKQLIIPGSSLKGAIRFRVEQSFKATHKVGACYVVRSQAPPSQKSWRHIKAYGINQPRYSCRDTRNPCIVCDMFGMMGMRGRLYFSDAVLIEGASEQLNLTVRRGKTSREEVIKPGAKFQWDLYFENLSKDELGLLFFAMNLDIKKPIILGRHRYAIQRTGNKEIKFGHILLGLEDIMLYEGLKRKKIQHLEEFIQDVVRNMRQIHGRFVERLKDWEVLPC